MVATAIVFAASIVLTYPATGSNSGPVPTRPAPANTAPARPAPAHIVVQPALVTITVAVPELVSKIPTGPDAAISSTGATGAAVAIPIHVQVLPGKAQWLADTNPTKVRTSGTRILSGKVLYAIGDNHAWKLVATITGADGYLARPDCTSAYASIPGDVGTVTTGDAVVLDGTPIVICQGTQGRSGGIYTAAVDIDGNISGDVNIAIELIR
jgi:hypothetical protein